jgi:3-hydroxymyristoyl/3-hydroxydecanoyl-(acyl carrier protein) dehydratase
MAQFSELMNSSGELDKESIKNVIPYDDPFLFLDKVTHLDKTKITAIRNMTGKEDFFKGHFVDFPIMPGALTVEAMGQAGTLLVRSNIPNHKEKDVLAYKLKNVEFMAPILPGSKLRFEVEVIAQDVMGAVLKGRTFIKDKVVAEAYFMLYVVDKKEFRSKFTQ